MALAMTSSCVKTADKAGAWAYFCVQWIEIVWVCSTAIDNRLISVTSSCLRCVIKNNSNNEIERRFQHRAVKNFSERSSGFLGRSSADTCIGFTTSHILLQWTQTHVNYKHFTSDRIIHNKTFEVLLKYRCRRATFIRTGGQWQLIIQILQLRYSLLNVQQRICS